MDLSTLTLKQKVMAATGIAVAALIVYGQVIHAPVSRKVHGYQQRVKKYDAQLADLKAKFPPVDSQKEKIAALEVDYQKLLEKIKEVESKMPPKRETSQLIGEFTRLAKELKLVSLRQKTVVQDGFTKIFIEIKLAASYGEAITYIARLESISPFLRVEEVDINETKGKTFEEGGAPVKIVISSILGDAPQDVTLKADDAVKSPEVTRDILASSAKPLATLNEKDFRIEGITFQDDFATAIINGEVYRVGSEIKGYTVKKITRDTVILTDGTEDHLLILKP